MSRNGSGVYNLPAGNPVVTGTTIDSAWANTTMQNIADALTQSVASDGQTPMSGPLNMATNNINNVGTLTTLNSAYTGTLTGGTGVVNLGSGQFYKASGGNVLIGSTTDNGYKFKVIGGNASNVLIDNDGSRYTQLLLQRNATANTGGDLLVDGTSATMSMRMLLVGAMTFNTSTSAGDGTERMRIDSSGNLCVGTTSNLGRIGATQTGNNVCIRANNDSTSFSGTNFWSTLTGGSNTNTTAIHYAAYTTSGNVFIVYGNGNVQNTNNSYGAISDIKLKENIVDATPKLEDLCKVKVRNYNLKSNPNQKQIGVVAQELEKVFAGLVEETEDKDVDGNDLGTTTKTVKYSVFVPMLIKAIQEQQALIENLTTRLNALEGK